jgi:hypothetical protein
VTDQERAEAFLRKRSGLSFCAACLAHELGANAFAGRSLLWWLQALPGYEMRGGRCAGCLRGKRVIRHVRGVSVAGANGDVVAFLLSNVGIPLCDACLAFATERSLADIQRILDELRPFGEFQRQEAVCTVCVRTKPVTCAVVGESTREDQALVTRTEMYQGWRLDLLSYRVSNGWRPFVLIKGPTTSRTPEAPSLLWGAFGSKTEADRHAVHTAREWVDKHFGG